MARTKTTTRRPSDAESTAKRLKKSPEDDLICPITLELPWDPVAAEDDRIYERDAIEKWIEQKQGLTLNSPFTNKTMGPALKPMPQIKSLIDTLVENGTIKGPLADKWRERVKMKEFRDDLVREAQNGNLSAMNHLGHQYRMGSGGFEKDVCLAFYWFEKAHSQGHNNSTANLGVLILTNPGVLPESNESGIMYISLAAAKGSNYAAYFLGKVLARGDFGLTGNKKQAIYWLEQSLVLDGNLSESGKNNARNCWRNWKILSACGRFDFLILYAFFQTV